MTKTELFLKLAAPDKNGVSRWVYVSEFVGEYADLTFGNGASWARKESTLAKKYNVEFYKKDTPGNSIDRIRLNGFNNGDYSQHINASIKREIKSRRCYTYMISHRVRLFVFSRTKVLRYKNSTRCRYACSKVNKNILEW